MEMEKRGKINERFLRVALARFGDLLDKLIGRRGN